LQTDANVSQAFAMKLQGYIAPFLLY
jgi:hypothetical protein